MFDPNQSSKLLRFFVQGMLAAETAILVHLKTIGIVLFVLDRVIVSLLALLADKCDFNSHNGTS